MSTETMYDDILSIPDNNNRAMKMYIYISLNGNKKISAHLLSKIGNLICSRHSFRSTVVANIILPDSFTLTQRVLIYHLILVPWLFLSWKIS